MPLYDYQCRDCSTVVEVRHGFREAYDGTCAACGGTLARVFNPAGIVFKGSGFYVTDSRKGGPSGEGSSKSEGGEKKSGSSSEPAVKSEPAGKSESTAA